MFRSDKYTIAEEVFNFVPSEFNGMRSSFGKQRPEGNGIPASGGCADSPDAISLPMKMFSQGARAPQYVSKRLQQRR